MLRKAAYALSLSCDGCKRQDQTFVRQGVRYYCEALVELRDALQNPVVAAEDESLLPTCLLLADYEVSPLIDPTQVVKPNDELTNGSVLQWVYVAQRTPTW